MQKKISNISLSAPQLEDILRRLEFLKYLKWLNSAQFTTTISKDHLIIHLVLSIADHIQILVFIRAMICDQRCTNYLRRSWSEEYNKTDLV